MTCLVRGSGVEPELAGPQPAGLPLHHRPVGGGGEALPLPSGRSPFYSPPGILTYIVTAGEPITGHYARISHRNFTGSPFFFHSDHLPSFPPYPPILEFGFGNLVAGMSILEWGFMSPDSRAEVVFTNGHAGNPDHGSLVPVSRCCSGSPVRESPSCDSGIPIHVWNRCSVAEVCF